MRNELALLSSKLNELGNSADEELKTYREIRAKLETLSIQITSTSNNLSSDRSNLNNVLRELKREVGDTVHMLNDATRDFGDKVSKLDDLNKLLSSLYEKASIELNNIKQMQEEHSDIKIINKKEEE